MCAWRIGGAGLRTIAVDGVPIPPPPEHVYLMLYKPRGYITTLSDERGRRTAASLVDCGTRVYPVGRLDYDSEGLLLFTNDGALADRLMHPRREISKVYEVTARGPLDGAAERLRRPLVLDGYRIRPPEVEQTAPGRFLITIHEGRNRQIRRMCAAARAGGAPAAAHCRGTAAARNARARRMASAHRSGACRAAAGNRRGRSCMTADILTNIHNKLTTFSKGQRRIATYILESYDKAAFLTAGALGKITQVSESTVVRFAAELGYDGYPAMQRALQEMVLNRLTSVQRIEVTDERLGEQDVVSTILQADMDRLRHTNEHLDREAFSGAVEALLQARCIYVLGVRSSAALASSLSYYLHYMFENVRLITTPSTSEVFEQLVRISPQDAVIGISFPRYSTATGKALQYCREAGAQVIALTDSETAPIARSAHYLLTAKSDMVSLVDSLVAPMSVVNALIVALTSRRKHETAQTLERLEQVWDQYHVYEKVHI